MATWSPPQRVRMSFSDRSPMVPAMIQPRIEINWSPDYKIKGKKISEIVHVHFNVNREKYRDLNYFFQGESDTWILLEFWTDDVQAVKSIYNDLLKMFEGHLDA